MPSIYSLPPSFGLTLRVPTREEEERERRFRTFANYIHGWVITLDDDFGGFPTAPLESIVTQPKFHALRSRCPRLDRLRSSLPIAWSTEMLMRNELMQFGRTAMIRYANSWLPIKAYYAIYQAVVALNSISSDVEDRHRAQINVINDRLRQERWLPAVVRLACVSCYPAGTSKFVGLPDNADMELSNLRRPTSVTEAKVLVAKSLKTTLSDMMEVKREDWKRTQRLTRVSGSAAASIAAKMPPATIFDFMLRIRIRCNYQETEAMVHGPKDATEAFLFAEALGALTWHLMAFIETLIAGKIGEKSLREMVTQFSKSGGLGTGRLPVADRWSVA